MPSNHLVLCYPLLLPPSIFPSIKVFPKESVLRVSFSISPSNEYSELISIRTDWFDLLALQGTLKSLLQHHSSKTSILWCSAFFMVQLSHLYMTTGKTIALTIRTFVNKVISLLFNTLSMFVQLLVIPWTITRQAPLSMGFFPGKNVGVGCHTLLQGIFPTQGSNTHILHPLHLLEDYLPLNHQRSIFYT